MGFNENDDFAASICGIKPGFKYPTERLDTTTGDGNAPVTCLFNVDSDGNVQDMRVMVGATDIIKALSEDQVTELEYDCWKSYLDDTKQRNAEQRIESWRAARELA